MKHNDHQKGDRITQHERRYYQQNDPELSNGKNSSVECQTTIQPINTHNSTSIREETYIESLLQHVVRPKNISNTQSFLRKLGMLSGGRICYLFQSQQVLGKAQVGLVTRPRSAFVSFRLKRKLD